MILHIHANSKNFKTFSELSPIYISTKVILGIFSSQLSQVEKNLVFLLISEKKDVIAFIETICHILKITNYFEFSCNSLKISINLKQR